MSLENCSQCGKNSPTIAVATELATDDWPPTVLLCENCFQSLQTARCCHCGREFPISDLLVYSINEERSCLCGGCKQSWEHEYIAFEDELNLSPRKEAVNQILAANFLIECGWKVQPPKTNNHLIQAAKKWEKWKKNNKIPWRIVAADYITGNDVLKRKK